MTRSGDPARRLSEALRAQATGAGRPGPAYGPPAPRATRRATGSASGIGAGTALGLALLAGAVLGVLLAMLSLWAPGLLPALG